MVSKKGKRKIVYGEKVFYWFVRKNKKNIPRIYILSEDKEIRLEYPLTDTEESVTPKEIKRLLDRYFKD